MNEKKLLEDLFQLSEKLDRFYYCEIEKIAQSHQMETDVIDKKFQEFKTFPKPIDLDLNMGKFCGSEFKNNQLEENVCRIAMYFKENSPYEWTSFNLKEFAKWQGRTEPTELFKKHCMCLVNGGIVPDESGAIISGGWLSFNRGVYTPTDKLISYLIKLDNNGK